MKTTETSVSLPNETFQITPKRYYTFLGIYLFAFFFKAQVLALFWGSFFIAQSADLFKQPKDRRQTYPLLFRILLCGLLTYGFGIGHALSVGMGHLLSMVYLLFMPRPQIIQACDIKRFKIVGLIVLGIMSLTLFTHGIIINV